MSYTLPAHLDQVLLAFERNSRANAALLAGLVDADLGFAAGGGWSIGKHLCHIATFRYGWLATASPHHADHLRPLVMGMAADDFDPDSVSVLRLADTLRAGDAAALGAVEAALVEGRHFAAVYRSHPTGLLVHILVHDAHHRGQVMSLLRQSGRSRGEMERLEEASWLPWRE